MKITSVDLTPVDVPYRPELGTVVTYVLTASSARHVMVQVRTDEGITGLGEAIPRPFVYGETMQSVIGAIENVLFPAMRGQDPRDVEKIWSQWSRMRGNWSAKTALDTALHDIIGKQAGLPLYKMLGGYADGRIPVSMPIAIGETAHMVKQAVQAIEAGFQGIKMKIGKDLRSDLRNIAAIRHAVGDEVFLYVDANTAYTAGDALRAILKFEAHGIGLVEEPVAIGDFDGRARLARAIRTPILLDESINELADVLREIKLGSAGALSLRNARSGFTLSRKYVGLAEAGNVPCMIGSHRELGVGTAANAHLGAAYACMAYPAELGVHVWVEDGLLTEPLRIERGYLYLPSGPGLGVELDARKLARYRI